MRTKALTQNIGYWGSLFSEFLDQSRDVRLQLQARYLLQFQRFLPEGKYVGVSNWIDGVNYRCTVEVEKVEWKEAYRISVNISGMPTSQWGDVIEFGASTPIDMWGGEDNPTVDYSRREAIYSTSEAPQAFLNVVKNSKTELVTEVYGDTGKRQWRCSSLTKAVTQKR